MTLQRITSRNMYKEFKMFEENIMWSREDNSVLWLCKDRAGKKRNVEKVFRWVNTKNIINVEIWQNSKNSIKSIQFKNYCGKTITIHFRLKIYKPEIRYFEIDDMTPKED